MSAPRLDPRRERRAWLLAGGTVAAFLALVIFGIWNDVVRSSKPAAEWRDDAFVLSGEFRADGSCTVLLDGQPLADAVATTRTVYDRDAIVGASPTGTEVHDLQCGAPRPIDSDSIDSDSIAPDPVNPDSMSDAGDFSAWTARAEGGVLAPGRYRVVAEGALESGDSTAFEATLRHPRFAEERAYLVGYQGYVRIIRADTARVVGTFRIVARRKRRSPFS